MCLAAIGLVLSIERADGLATAEVDVSGKRMRIGVDLTPEVEPGMYVSIHAGHALDALTPDQAADAMALRAEIDRAAGS